MYTSRDSCPCEPVVYAVAALWEWVAKASISDMVVVSVSVALLPSSVKSKFVKVLKRTEVNCHPASLVSGAKEEDAAGDGRGAMHAVPVSCAMHEPWTVCSRVVSGFIVPDGGAPDAPLDDVITPSHHHTNMLNLK